MLKRRLVAAAGGVGCAFALGLWIGALLFSDSTNRADRERTVAATALARSPIARVAPPATSTVDQPSAGRPQIEKPPAADAASIQHPRGAPDAAAAGDPRTALAPTGGELRTAPSPVGDRRRSVTPAADEVRVATSLGAAKPAARAPAARNQPERQPPAAPVQTVARGPEIEKRAPAPRSNVVSLNSSDVPRFRGSLSIRSEPRGALVSVDGQVVGATPLVLKGVPVGSRVVRIESDGYERWSSATRVVANKETEVVATLQREGSH